MTTQMMHGAARTSVRASCGGRHGRLRSQVMRAVSTCGWPGASTAQLHWCFGS